MGPTPPWIFYLLMYGVPAAAGWIGGRYLRGWLNFGLMLLVFHIDFALLRFGNTGEFPPPDLVFGLVPGILTSPGGWVPLLLFLLVAISASRRRIPAIPSAREGAP